MLFHPLVLLVVMASVPLVLVVLLLLLPLSLEKLYISEEERGKADVGSSCIDIVNTKGN